ncbi:hypothetical protein GYMLUDRAFT_45708 [Collybiopsis luxurians FD-317 M1]|uniref:NmrA-like domain-containing protein n=1 Tax=Collybiopsis luxurians FD-317 M1 TaxID=944289 RepID=A0A0D0CQV3_9AGAR|nr:hypothetical protein GYMLUDRAFT_45708 [Collybiopsis luxurians FD-317 M1]
MSVASVFLLGATGYVGGHILTSLAKDYPEFPVRALVRNLTPEKTAALKALHAKIDPIEGSLADLKLIEEEAKKADIVINFGTVGDLPSVEALLRGQLARSDTKPTIIPIHIYLSGTGLLADGSKGELWAPEELWIDTKYDSSSLEKSKVELMKNDCLAIVEAEKTGKIRTMIMCPGIIYGIGAGLQKISSTHRVYLDFIFEHKTGYSGTFGPGRNVYGFVHIQDIADAVSMLIQKVLAAESLGTVETGFYFVVSKYMVSSKDLCSIIGDTLYKKGLVSKPGATPYPPPLAELGDENMNLILNSNTIGYAERLSKMGWTAKHTEAVNFFESVPREIELALK